MNRDYYYCPKCGKVGMKVKHRSSYWNFQKKFCARKMAGGTCGTPVEWWSRNYIP